MVGASTVARATVDIDACGLATLICTSAGEISVAGESAATTAAKTYPAQVHATAGGQYPFAAVVSCMDSRVTPEVTFDCGLGDIFGLREAGNVVDVDTLGGLEYAAKVVGVKMIVVVIASRGGGFGFEYVEIGLQRRGDRKLQRVEDISDPVSPIVTTAGFDEVAPARRRETLRVVEQ